MLDVVHSEGNWMNSFLGSLHSLISHLQECNCSMGRVTGNDGGKEGMLSISMYLFCSFVYRGLVRGKHWAFSAGDVLFDIMLLIILQFYVYSINSITPPSIDVVWVNEQLYSVPNIQSNLAVGYYYTELLVYCLQTCPVQLVLIFKFVASTCLQRQD